MAQANSPTDKVRALQRALYVAAKRNGRRKFHALYDRIARADVLLRAWDQVRSNKGAAGIDGETLEAVETYGVERMLAEVRGLLVANGKVPRGFVAFLEYACRLILLRRRGGGYEFIHRLLLEHFTLPELPLRLTQQWPPGSETLTQTARDPARDGA